MLRGWSRFFRPDRLAHGETGLSPIEKCGYGDMHDQLPGRFAHLAECDHAHLWPSAEGISHSVAGQVFLGRGSFLLEHAGVHLPVVVGPVVVVVLPGE